jgi:hypothetical protein
MGTDRHEAALESAVRALRAASQRAGCPATFKAGDKKELARVLELHPQLPTIAKKFYEKHDPVDALFSPAPKSAIGLIQLKHLEDGQLGYSVHGATGKDLTGSADGDWRDTWIVFGDDNDNPFFLECSEAKDGDAPVYYGSRKGGKWTRVKVASSFEKFLRLCAAYMDGYRTWDDPEADNFDMPDRVRDTIARSLHLVDPGVDPADYWLA